MENKTRYLLDKDSVLLKDSKERLFKEVLEKDMPLMQYLLPKIEKFKLVKGYQEILIKQQNKTPYNSLSIGSRAVIKLK